MRFFPRQDHVLTKSSSLADLKLHARARGDQPGRVFRQQGHHTAVEGDREEIGKQAQPQQMESGNTPVYPDKPEQ